MTSEFRHFEIYGSLNEIAHKFACNIKFKVTEIVYLKLLSAKLLADKNVPINMKVYNSKLYSFFCIVPFWLVCLTTQNIFLSC